MALVSLHQKLQILYSDSDNFSSLTWTGISEINMIIFNENNMQVGGEQVTITESFSSLQK